MTQRTCYLHIGMMKTGSTSIQAAFHGYRDDRIEYLPFPRRNHSALLRNVAKENPEPHLRVVGRGLSEREIERRAAHHRKQFRKILDETNRDLIISSEELASSFSPANIAHLMSLLRAPFDTVRVIGYVREPVGFMTSVFQQRVKLKDIAFDFETLYPNYRKLLRKWVEQDAIHDIRLTEFAPSRLVGGSVVHDFASKVGIDPSKVSDAPALLNQSLSAEATALLYAYRRTRGSPRAHIELARHNPAVITILQGFGNQKLMLDPQKCRAVVDSHPADMRWIERQLGTPFIELPSPNAGTYVSTERELLSTAESNLDSFREYLSACGHDRAARHASIGAIFDNLYQFRQR